MKHLAPGAALGALLFLTGWLLLAYTSDGIKAGFACLLYGVVILGAVTVAAAFTALVGLLRRFR